MSKEKLFPLTPHDAYATNGLSAADTAAYNDEPSLTRQEFSDECDINVIMAQYEKTGVVSHVSQRQPMYIDYTALPLDLAEFMAQMQNAETAFMSLPAKVRKEFDNDPVKFVDFAADPENLDQMREWGLAPPAKPEAPEAPPADPTPDPTPKGSVSEATK